MSAQIRYIGDHAVYRERAALRNEPIREHRDRRKLRLMMLGWALFLSGAAFGALTMLLVWVNAR